MHQRAKKTNRHALRARPNASSYNEINFTNLTNMSSPNLIKLEGYMVILKRGVSFV